MPATRTRRAAFLLNLPSRVFAATTPCSAILLSSNSSAPPDLTKQRADAGLHVNTFDRCPQQAGDRQHFNLSLPFQLLRLFAQRDGISDDHFPYPRAGDALDRRP